MCISAAIKSRIAKDEAITTIAIKFEVSRRLRLSLKFFSFIRGPFYRSIRQSHSNFDCEHLKQSSNTFCRVGSGLYVTMMQFWKIFSNLSLFRLDNVKYITHYSIDVHHAFTKMIIGKKAIILFDNLDNKSQDPCRCYCFHSSANDRCEQKMRQSNDTRRLTGFKNSASVLILFKLYINFYIQVYCDNTCYFNTFYQIKLL